MYFFFLGSGSGGQGLFFDRTATGAPRPGVRHWHSRGKNLLQHKSFFAGREEVPETDIWLWVIASTG